LFEKVQRVANVKASRIFHFIIKVLEFELFTQVEAAVVFSGLIMTLLCTYVHSVLLNTTCTIQFQNDVNKF